MERVCYRRSDRRGNNDFTLPFRGISVWDFSVSISKCDRVPEWLSGYRVKKIAERFTPFRDRD